MELFKKPRNDPRGDRLMLDVIARLAFRSGVGSMQLADEEQAGVQQGKTSTGGKRSSDRQIVDSRVQSRQALQNFNRDLLAFPKK
jgi:hypothetical protein